MNIIKTPLTG